MFLKNRIVFFKYQRNILSQRETIQFSSHWNFYFSHDYAFPRVLYLKICFLIVPTKFYFYNQDKEEKYHTIDLQIVTSALSNCKI